jgi:uncharacterized protein involved in type VI secretion and phage assembly
MMTKLHGLQVAVVVTAPGDARHRYSVKVELPWLGGSDTTRWARVAVPMAGGHRGCYAPPSPGDQVVVAFERGDANRPIVIGSLWSRVQPRGDDVRETTSIRSRAGHRIAFDDRNGGGVTITDANGNAVTLDANGLSIVSRGDLTVRAARDVVIAARSGTAAAVTVAVRAGATAAIASDATATISAARIATTASLVTAGARVGLDSSGAPP